MTINLSGIGIDYIAILPELVVVGTAIVVLFLELVVPPDRRQWLAAATVVGLLGALAVLAGVLIGLSRARQVPAGTVNQADHSVQPSAEPIPATATT